MGVVARRKRLAKNCSGHQKSSQHHAETQLSQVEKLGHEILILTDMNAEKYLSTVIFNYHEK